MQRRGIASRPHGRRTFRTGRRLGANYLSSFHPRGRRSPPEGRRYATSLTYVEKLCNIIEKWNLQQFDAGEEVVTILDLYRVRSAWEDAASQKGAFYSLENAKACADENPGYSVYDSNGEVVYSSERKVPFTVKVSIPDLVIRTGPGTKYASTGRYTGIGIFTIIEVQGRWGKLKSGAGWISLKYTGIMD